MSKIINGGLPGQAQDALELYPSGNNGRQRVNRELPQRLHVTRPEMPEVHSGNDYSARFRIMCRYRGVGDHVLLIAARTGGLTVL